MDAPGGGGRGEEVASAAAQEARAAVAAAARALAAGKNEPQEEEDGSVLGVSYDLLTAVTERLDDVALFDPSQTDEEGLTAVLTTGIDRRAAM